MRTSLYRHWDKDGRLLYVGVSLSAVHRLGQHADNAHWFGAISKVTVEHFADRLSAITAERAAIMSEQPEHNIRGKKQAEEERKRAEKEEAKRALAMARARTRLTRQVVELRPVYSIAEAADFLSISSAAVRRLIDDGELSFITLPNRAGTPSRYVTGWQLVDLLEHREAMAKKAVA